MAAIWKNGSFDEAASKVEASQTIRLISRLLIPVVCLVIFLPLLSTEAPFDYRHDWNIPITNAALRGMWLGPDGFTTWNPDQFGSVPFYPTMAPYLALLSSLAAFGFQTGAVERILLFAILFGAAYAMRYFLREFGASPLGASIGGAAYVTTAYLFTEIAKGVLQGGLSYAAMPLIAAVFLHDDPRKKWRIDRYALLTGLLWGLSSVQIQYLVVNGIMLGILAIATGRIPKLIQAFAAVLLTDAYFLLPLATELPIIHAALAEQSPTEFIYQISPSFWQALRLTGCGCTFPEQAASEQGILQFWPFAGFLWAGTVVALALAARSRQAVIFLGLFLGGVVLMGGVAVLGPLYPLIVEKIPGLYAFRESLNFGSLPSFGAAGSLAFGISALHRYGRRVWQLAIGIVAVVALAYAMPFLLNGLSTQLAPLDPPNSASIADGYLRAHSGDERAMYLPMLVPMQPNGSPYTGIEPFVSWGPLATFGNYVPTQYSRVVAGSVYHTDVFDFPTYARLGNLKYVDVRSWLTERFSDATDARNTSQDYNIFNVPTAMNSVLGAGGKLVADYGQDKIYELPFSEQNASYKGDGLLVVSGGFSALRVTSRLAPISALVAQQPQPVLEKLLARTHFLAIENGDSFDLAVANLPISFVQSAGKGAQATDANAGWGNTWYWNDWWWFRQEFIDTPEDIAISASQAHTNLIQTFLEPPGPAELWIKAYVGRTQGSMSVIDPNNGTHVVTTAARAEEGYRWFHVADVRIRHAQNVVSLRGLTGENSVASIVLAPRGIVRAAEKTANTELSSHEIIDVVTFPSVTYDFPLRRDTYTLRILAAWKFPENGRVAVSFAGKTYSVHVKKGAVWSDIRLKVPADTSDRLAYVASPRLRVAGIALFSHQLRYALQPINSRSLTAYKSDRPANLFEIAQNYAPGWRSSNSADVHFVANGYANGWDSSKPLPRSVYYEHLAPTLGRIVSALFILTVILVWSLPAIRRGRNARPL